MGLFRCTFHAMLRPGTHNASAEEGRSRFPSAESRSLVTEWPELKRRSKANLTDCQLLGFFKFHVALYLMDCVEGKFRGSSIGMMVVAAGTLGVTIA